MYMSDYKEYDERDQIGENDEERVIDDIKVLNLGKMSSQKSIENIQKESDKRNRMDMRDDKKSE